MTAKEALNKVVNEGATIQQDGVGEPDFVLALVEIVDETHYAFAPIFAENERDVHLWEYDRIEHDGEGSSVSFYRKGFLTYVTSLENSIYDDEKLATARNAFERWKEQKANYEKFFQNVLNSYRK